MSVDPLSKSYPMLTPYQFASNSPIASVDLDGLESITVHSTHYLNEALNLDLDNMSAQEILNWASDLNCHEKSSSEFGGYKNAASQKWASSQYESGGEVTSIQKLDGPLNITLYNRLEDGTVVKFTLTKVVDTDNKANVDSRGKSSWWNALNRLFGGESEGVKEGYWMIGIDGLMGEDVSGDLHPDGDFDIIEPFLIPFGGGTKIKGDEILDLVSKIGSDLSAAIANEDPENNSVQAIVDNWVQVHCDFCNKDVPASQKGKHIDIRKIHGTETDSSFVKKSK